MLIKTPDSVIRDWLYETLHEAIIWEGTTIPVYDGSGDGSSNEEIVLGQSNVSFGAINKDLTQYFCDIQVNLYTREKGTSQLDNLTKQVYETMRDNSTNSKIPLSGDFTQATFTLNNYVTLPRQADPVSPYSERITEFRFTCM